MSSKTYPYDPEFPIVAVNALGFGFARFTCMSHARHYAPECTPVDTTPAPRVPEDAKFVTWKLASGATCVSRAMRGLVQHDGGWVKPESLPGVTPETRFTVLEPREAPELMDEQMRDGDGSDDR